MVAKGEGVREKRIESLGLADANLSTGWINGKVLPYSTGNYIQYPVINQMEKHEKSTYIHTHTHTYIHAHACMCIYTELLGFTAEINTTL